MMLWERSLLERDSVRVARFLTADASPQGGWEYLLTREDSMERDLTNGFVRGHPLEGFAWKSQLKPVACLGALDAGSTVKTMKIKHGCHLEAGDQLQLWREQVKGHLSDRGHERKVAKAPNLDVPRDEAFDILGRLASGDLSFFSQEGFNLAFFLYAMQHAGHKHLMFNGLREAIWTDVEYEGWKGPLHSTLKVLGGEYRSVFLAKNAPHASAHEKAIIVRISSKFLDYK